MKKLIFVFVTLFTLVLISGCGARQNTVRFDEGSDVSEDSMENTLDESSLDEEEKEELEAMEEETDKMVKKDEAVEGEDEKDEVVKKEVPKGKLAVTSFDGAFLKTNVNYHVIRGTAPSGTHKIMINDYTLGKFTPGQSQWSYIASTDLGTINKGLNNYIVKTFDQSGAQTASIIFSINYEPPMIPDELPGVGASHWLMLILSFLTAGTATIFRKLRWL